MKFPGIGAIVQYSSIQLRVVSDLSWHNKFRAVTMKKEPVELTWCWGDNGEDWTIIEHAKPKYKNTPKEIL